MTKLAETGDVKAKKPANKKQKVEKQEEEKKEVLVKTASHSALHKWSYDDDKTKAAEVDSKKDQFAFMKGTPTTPKENEEESKDSKSAIVGELVKLMNIYQAAGDKGKVMGYRRAISNIKAYAKPITSADQMDEIAFVGDGIKKKVAEFLEEGKMSKLQNLEEDPKLMALDALAQIWGVGP